MRAPEAHLVQDENGEPDFTALLADPAERIMQCVLDPGEVLYLPALWWHRIHLLTDSIGLGRKCLDEKNLQQHVKMRLGVQC